MRLTGKAALMGAALLATTACASVATHSNRYTVVAKTHTGSHWEPVGKPGGTKIDHYDFHPEVWEFTLRDADGIEIDFKVSKKRYDSTKVGDHLAF